MVALGYGDGRRPLNMTQLREVAHEKVYNLADSMANIKEAVDKASGLACGKWTILEMINDTRLNSFLFSLPVIVLKEVLGRHFLVASCASLSSILSGL